MGAPSDVSDEQDSEQTTFIKGKTNEADNETNGKRNKLKNRKKAKKSKKSAKVAKEAKLATLEPGVKGPKDIKVNYRGEILNIFYRTSRTSKYYGLVKIYLGTGYQGGAVLGNIFPFLFLSFMPYLHTFLATLFSHFLAFLLSYFLALLLYWFLT